MFKKRNYRKGHEATDDHRRGDFDGPTSRPKRRRSGATWDDGYRDGYDQATAQARRGHRRRG